LKNKEVRATFEDRIAAVSRSLEELRGLCYTPPS
jgi:hypothetical protein